MTLAAASPLPFAEAFSGGHLLLILGFRYFFRVFLVVVFQGKLLGYLERVGGQPIETTPAGRLQPINAVIMGMIIIMFFCLGSVITCFCEYQS